MRVLIVDDEAPARGKLRRMLGAHPDVVVVGEAASGAEALALVAEHAPEVLFLDVQMPEIDGFDVAASLPGSAAPALVFVTAFDRHALRAFEACAIDYLLKPVEPERLSRTLGRLRTRPASTPLHPAPAHLLVPDRGRTHVVAVADIEWLEAADNYVVVHAPGRALLMRRTLAALLADLGPGFFRVHRGAAVALAAVQAVESRGKGDALVLTRSGERVSCSRPFSAGLRERLQGQS